MAENWTPQQRQAVKDRGGRLLVSAAAGSGKTKVLVDRLMDYLTDPVEPANLDDFLIITYTKAAASELRGKIAAKLTDLLAENPENRHLQHQLQRLYLTQISTVHGFCGELLRGYAYELDIPADFRTGDENECREIRETVLKEILEQAYAHAGDDPSFRAFVDTQGIGRGDGAVPDIIMRVYDSARCHLDPQRWLAACEHSAQAQGMTDAAQTPWGSFLMQELRTYLQLQRRTALCCAQWAQDDPDLQAVAQIFREDAARIEELTACETWDAVVSRRDLKFATMRFPKKLADPALKQMLQDARKSYKDGIRSYLRTFTNTTAQIVRDCSANALAVRGLTALVRAFDEAYSREKRRRRILDFSDLEHRTLDLLLGDDRTEVTQIAMEVGGRYREVLVDEYQDSNAVQDAIFSALTYQRGNCFLVGDVKQSIYQFRLADPGIFLEKYKRFRPAEEAQAGEDRKVLLSRNFRSGGYVLSAVNDVFRLCMSPAVGGMHYTEAEALQEGLAHTPLGEPEVELWCIQEDLERYCEEADFAADRICTLLDGTHQIRDAGGLRPICPEDIVILLRSPGSTEAYYRQALERRGLRTVSGGGNDLLKAGEIRTLRALLQTISNPRQDIPLLAVLTSPLFGFTAEELASIRADWREGGMYDALLASPMQKSSEFVAVLSELRHTARLETLSGLMQTIILRTRIDSVYGAMEGGAVRTENLRRFLELAIEYEATGRKELSRFLEYLDALERKGINTAGGGNTDGCITIMSIHKSKGLEFPVVLLCGLSRRFNREDTRAPVLCDTALGLGLNAVDTENRVRYATVAKRAIAAKMIRDSVSEELRVLYVAMTRARDRLIMTYCDKNLESLVSDLTRQISMGQTELACREASCPGIWVLLAALHRTEAGELFRLGGNPGVGTVSEMPWLIRVVQAGGQLVQAQQAEDSAQEPLSREMLERIKQALAFQYPHQAATRTPSKQTATQRKGRELDQEAAEHTEAMMIRPVSRTRGKDHGIAVHTAMQYIRFVNCKTLAGVEAELDRLEERGLLSKEQREAVSARQIFAFFCTPVGKKLCEGAKCLREFKFSILEDVPEDEQVLLQGVVDCALLEPDGLTVVDFKTDFVTKETLMDRVARYRPQVQTYASALSRIYAQPVKYSYLYFFHMDALVEVK